MKRRHAAVLCLGLALPPLPGAAQEDNPKTDIDFALQIAHCQAYYTAATNAQGMDAFDKEIAGMGQEILDLTLMDAPVDQQLIADVAKALRPYLARIPADQLLDLYDDGCDEVIERID